MPAFTDCGKTIDIHDTRHRESVLAALQLSAQKWGTMTVTGNEQFLRTCVELAAERGFKIANPDLQEAIAVERERQQRAKDVEQVPRDDVRGTSVKCAGHDLSPAFRRHRARAAPPASA